MGQSNPFADFARCLCDGAWLMVGVPNYVTYVVHVARTHPGQPPMTRAEFFRNRQDARYGGGSCCFLCF